MSFEESFDLKELLSNEGIGFTENSSHYFLDECPNCGGKHKLCIDKGHKLWICYSCVQTDQIEENKDGKGNLWTLLIALGFDDRQVKQIFKDRVIERYVELDEFEEIEWNPFDNIEEDQQVKEVVRFNMPHYLIPLDCDPKQIQLFSDCYKYLFSRFVNTRKQIIDFNLHYDAFRKRVVFPAMIDKSFCVGYQARDITERFKVNHPKCQNKECDLSYKRYFVGEEANPVYCPNCGSELELSHYPKSLNTRDFPKTEFFFNQQNVDWGRDIVLVEGPFDCVTVDNSLAFLGKVLSETQFNILIKNAKASIILYLDGDSHGDYSTGKIYDQLRPFFNIKIVYSKDGDDPGSYDFKQNLLKVNSACKPSEWFARKGLMYM